MNSGGGGQLQSGSPIGQSHAACNSTIRQTSLKLHPPGQSGIGKVGSANEILISVLYSSEEIMLSYHMVNSLTVEA